MKVKLTGVETIKTYSFEIEGESGWYSAVVKGDDIYLYDDDGWELEPGTEVHDAVLTAYGFVALEESESNES